MTGIFVFQTESESIFLLIFIKDYIDECHMIQKTRNASKSHNRSFYDCNNDKE